jgi:hypothetical protein
MYKQSVSSRGPEVGERFVAKCDKSPATAMMLVMMFQLWILIAFSK